MDQSQHLSHKLVPVRPRQQPVAIRVATYGLDDCSARRRLSERRAVSLRRGGIGTWALGSFGIVFDLAFDLLPHGGAVAGPPVDDGSGFFTGADAALG